MKTTLLFFGRLAEQMGREREVEMPDAGCTISELRDLLGDEAVTGALASVDRKIVGDEARVMPGQEIAFFSALSGG